MFDLSKIYVGGSFYFSSSDNLKTKCKEAKVPNDCCGVYIVYACCEDEESIVYIGSSGHMKDGRLVHRQGGLERRIYGKQQKISRGILWPKKMRELSINKLRICWYNTGDDNPLIVEYCLILEYLVRNKRLPAWNNELKLDSRLKNDLEIFIKDNNIEFLKIASTR